MQHDRRHLNVEEVIGEFGIDHHIARQSHLEGVALGLAAHHGTTVHGTSLNKVLTEGTAVEDAANKRTFNQDVAEKLNVVEGHVLKRCALNEAGIQHTIIKNAPLKALSTELKPCKVRIVDNYGFDSLLGQNPIQFLVAHKR